MRVLLATHRYFPALGGTERIVQTIAEGLVARGDSATVLTQAEPGAMPLETLNGVEVHRLRMRHVGGVRLPVGYLRTLRRLEADVFHLHGNRIWCADFYLPFSRWFRWPQLVTPHGFYQYDIRPRRFDRWYFERYLPRALRHFGRYAALTEREARQIGGWGFPTSRIARVPNGIPLAEFRDSGGSPPDLRARYGLSAPHVAVYVGGFYENKRVDRLLEAIEATRGRWALLVAGRDVPSSPFGLAPCRSLADRRGIEWRALGELPRSEVVAHLRGADAVVLGSDYEGFGVLLLEAMAAGRPFVSWAAGAAPELAAQGAGRCVRSLEEFASALQELEEPARRDEVGRRGRELSEEYSDGRMVERYREIYRALGSEPRR